MWGVWFSVWFLQHVMLSRKVSIEWNLSMIDVRELFDFANSFQQPCPCCPVPPPPSAGSPFSLQIFLHPGVLSANLSLVTLLLSAGLFIQPSFPFPLYMY